MANRPALSRPVWISIGDWLAIQDRARELRDQRATTRRLILATSQARLDPEELDWAWRQDTGQDADATAPESPAKHLAKPRRRTRAATCRACGYTWNTSALRPICSDCRSKAITIGAPVGEQ